VHVVKLILGPQLFFELGPSTARKNGIEVCLIKKRKEETRFAARVTAVGDNGGSISPVVLCNPVPAA